MTTRPAGDAMRCQVLHAIADLTIRHGVPPTIREIGDSLGGKSTGMLDYHLRILRDEGKVTYTPRRSRSLRVVGAAPGCRGCAARDEHIARLETELAAARTERAVAS